MALEKHNGKKKEKSANFSAKYNRPAVWDGLFFYKLIEVFWMEIIIAVSSSS